MTHSENDIQARTDDVNNLNIGIRDYITNHPEVMNSHIYTEAIIEAYQQMPQPNIKHATVFMLRHADDAQVTIDDTTLNNYGIKVLMLETAVNEGSF
jgi:thymidylate synthase